MAKMMDEPPEVTAIDHEFLDELLELAAQATPGPWYVRCMDDTNCMSSYGVSNIDGGEEHEDWTSSNWPRDELVAVTLLQTPYAAAIKDKKWFENAVLIAEMRTHIEELVRLAKIGKEFEERRRKKGD